VQGLATITKHPYAGTVLKLWNLRSTELLPLDGPGIPADVERMSKVLNVPAYTLLQGDPPSTLDARMGGIFGFLDPKHLLARRLPAKGRPPRSKLWIARGMLLTRGTSQKTGRSWI
jgi:hypothetical protein